MEWLGLQFFGPHMDNGQQLLYSSHNPYLYFSPIWWPVRLL